MNHYDFYTGEPTSVPQSFNESGTNMNTVSFSEPEYQYDPNIRYMQKEQMQYQMMGSNGYNYPIQQNFMNPPNPPPQNMVQGFGAGPRNPAAALLNNNPSFPQYNAPQQQTVYEDQTVHVPGFNTGSTMMLPTDIESICDQMQIDMMMEQEEAIERRNRRFQGYFNNNYGNNYYGIPYYSNYADETVTSKYRRKVEEMKQEAVRRRLDFNKRISLAVHSALGDDVSEEQINNLYNGYNYTIPGSTITHNEEQARLSRMVPVSNANEYVRQDQEISRQYNYLIDPNANMNEWLNNLGMVQTYYNLEEEYHRRRDTSQYYQGDSYRRILRRSIAQRDGEKAAENIPMGNEFATLNESATLLDDGTLNITLPPWIKNGQTSGADSIERVQVTNELEKHFEENRYRFLQSIMNQDGNGGG